MGLLSANTLANIIKIPLVSIYRRFTTKYFNRFNTVWKHHEGYYINITSFLDNTF